MTERASSDAVVVTHLNGGTLRPPGGIGGGFGADELVCHVLVLRYRSQVVLVDGGIGSKDIADPSNRLGDDFCAMADPVLETSQTIVARLRALGLDTGTVTDIVLTHPDRDHVGAVADVRDAQVHAHPTVPRTIRLPESARDKERIRPAQWSDPVRWAPVPSAADPWFGFPCWRLDGLDDAIALVDLPGHATGHAGVAVRQGDGWLLHAGDAYFHRSQIRGGEVPVGLAGFEQMVQEDDVARLDTQRRLAALPSEVRIVCSHDPVELVEAQRPR